MVIWYLRRNRTKDFRNRKDNIKDTREFKTYNVENTLVFFNASACHLSEDNKTKTIFIIQDIQHFTPLGRRGLNSKQLWVVRFFNSGVSVKKNKLTYGLFENDQQVHKMPNC